MSAPILIQALNAALRRVRGTEVVADWLQQHPDVTYSHLIAIGKAASAMALGALRARPQLQSGLVITKHHHLDEELNAHPQIECRESDHPVPGPNSLSAGERLRDYLQQAPTEARFLVLISGGASSLVEVLAPGLNLKGLRRLTENLLSEGLNIAEMNAVRRLISGIKGGRLAHDLDGRPTCALMISDVPGNDPAIIGSGPLTAVRDDALPDALSPQTRDILTAIEPIPVPPEEVFAQLETHIIATLEDAKQAVAQFAAQRGLAAHLHPEFLDEDAGQCGVRLAKQLMRPTTAPGLHIWGGETTVQLPTQPGRGGRNQHLALAAARALDGTQGIELLAVGTDGTDGPTDDAGGLVDGQTLSKGRALNLDAADSLGRADAGPYLAATEALVTTGPTGTNVMDLVLALKPTA